MNWDPIQLFLPFFPPRTLPHSLLPLSLSLLLRNLALPELGARVAAVYLVPNQHPHNYDMTLERMSIARAGRVPSSSCLRSLVYSLISLDTYITPFLHPMDPHVKAKKSRRRPSCRIACQTHWTHGIVLPKPNKRQKEETHQNKTRSDMLTYWPHCRANLQTVPPPQRNHETRRPSQRFCLRYGRPTCHIGVFTLGTLSVFQNHHRE